MNKTFSISEAFSFGWGQFKSHWKFWLIVYMIVYGASASGASNSSSPSSSKNQPLNNRISSITKPISNLESVVLGVNTTSFTNTAGVAKTPKIPLGILLLIPYGIIAVIGFIFLGLLAIATPLILQMGLMHLTFDVARGGNLDYRIILSDVSIKKAFRFLLLNIIECLIVFFGLCLFIIPGIYFAYRFMFAPYLLVDKNLSIGKALQESSNLTKGVKFKLLGFSFVGLFLTIFGLILFIVGVFPAIIVITLATSYIYVNLDKQMVAPVVTTENITA